MNNFNLLMWYAALPYDDATNILGKMAITEDELIFFTVYPQSMTREQCTALCAAATTQVGRLMMDTKNYASGGVRQQWLIAHARLGAELINELEETTR